MEAAWEKVVQDALEAGVRISGGAVPGARLRQLIAKAAAEAGFTFPPDPNQSFGRFLDQFPSIALVQRRPGRDMLVVPAKNAELLTSPPDIPDSSVLRRDLFEALTLIPRPDQPGPLYLRNTDAVLWPEPSAERPEDAIELPAVTFEEAVGDRREFASLTNVPREARAVLEDSLQSGKPLRTFSAAVRAHGLARKWHLFRVGKVLKRLQAWTQTHGVSWHAGWLVQGERAAEEVLGTAPSPSGQTNVQEFFVALSSVMKEGDLARISIPLDLVVKTWRRRV